MSYHACTVCKGCGGKAVASQWFGWLWPHWMECSECGGTGHMKPPGLYGAGLEMIVLEVNHEHKNFITQAIEKCETLGFASNKPGNKNGRCLGKICRDWLAATEYFTIESRND